MSIIGKFRDQNTRPRAIIWTGVGVLLLIFIMVLSAGLITSTKWFCAEPCHMVQGDTIASYEASSHSKISCMACHEPVNANPVVLMIAKVKGMAGIPSTLAGTFELPLNAGSAFALNEHEMGSKQCTQCHGLQREMTTSKGIIIDHDVHTQEGITCATCHNRVGHNDEAITLKLVGNRKHVDYMQMDACYRCHDLEDKKRAGGECKLCHTPEFDLIPETHDAAGWLPKGHAEAAIESLTEYGSAKVESEELIREGVSEEVAVPVEYCSTCHKKAFCDACHSKLAAALVVPKKK